LEKEKTQLQTLTDKENNDTEGGTGQTKEERELSESLRLMLMKNSEMIRNRLLNWKPIQQHTMPTESCRMHANYTLVQF